MKIFLVILLVAAMIATVVALVRGIVTFLQGASAEVRGERTSGPTESQLKSNRMMQQRILYQALAILICVVLLFAMGRT
ncbi:twin transmembrane helix small protein [Sphingomonas sp. CL5.1]|uniref:twin transmembrane helix small protein n=1 Tax=Sphingomonas sp. CL5.1 TaxID=2653203 RepID=UPI001582EC80|nr:twin transmembrane helix small protein [Sphingomonas sp. CL5.1]QKR98871.1 twin transmembrane helix small protein [Sphingomonas sp. CL5.1]